MSVREAKSRIDSKEFMRWIAYGRLEPYGPLADDLRAARIASVIANVNRNPNKRAYEVDDFMPDYDKILEVEEAMSAEDTMKMVQALAAHFGGNLKKKVH